MIVCTPTDFDVSRTLTYSNNHFLSLLETQSFDISFVRTHIAQIEGGERQKRRMNEAKSKVGRMKNLHVEFEELTRGNKLVGEVWRESLRGFPAIFTLTRVKTVDVIADAPSRSKDRRPKTKLEGRILFWRIQRRNGTRKGMAGSNSSSKAV